MWVGLFIFCMFLLIPIAIIVIPALLTRKENDLSFASGSMTNRINLSAACFFNLHPA